MRAKKICRSICTKDAQGQWVQTRVTSSSLCVVPLWLLVRTWKVPRKGRTVCGEERKVQSGLKGREGAHKSVKKGHAPLLPVCKESDSPNLRKELFSVQPKLVDKEYFPLLNFCLEKYGGQGDTSCACVPKGRTQFCFRHNPPSSDLRPTDRPSQDKKDGQKRRRERSRGGR